MAVRVFLAAGGERMVDTADAARVSGPFFVITRRRLGTDQVDTVLTLRTQDIVAAEVVKDGAVIDYVLGGAQRQNDVR
jgi:hypothetical protein